MTPAKSILDSTFRYVPAAATSVANTWRRFGWEPTTDDERKRRSQLAAMPAADAAPAAMAGFHRRRHFYGVRRNRRERDGRRDTSAEREHAS